MLGTQTDIRLFWAINEAGQVFDFPVMPDEINSFIELLTLLNMYRKN